MITIRVTPEDFQVDELPLYPPSGSGDHTFVRIQKRLRTTEAVARDLARAAGSKPRDVGYAGRKDRVAVTTQWFSVPGLDPTRAVDLELPGAQVLEAERHPHKLRTGHLRANRFALGLHDVDPAGLARARERLAEAVRRGLPNRFGPQRFGREGDNAARARSWLAGELRLRDRREARFLVSAWQAEVFNAVLAQRADRFDTLLLGDLAMRHDSGGLFEVEDPAAEAARAAAFEISPTGPIFGPRMAWPGGAVGEAERAVMRAEGLDPDALRLPGVRARGGRRALRMRPAETRLEAQGDRVELAFELPAGCFATVVLEELFGEVVDASHDTAGARGVS